jgi:phage shock protein A
MKMSRDEFERKKAEHEESIRLLDERIGRMKADLAEKRRAEAERAARRKRFLLFR